MNKKEEEIRRKVGITDKRAVNQKRTSENEQLNGEAIQRLIKEAILNKSLSEALTLYKTRMMTGEPKGASIAGASLGNKINAKTIGKATINASTKSKNNARGIEATEKVKGENERDDN